MASKAKTEVKVPVLKGQQAEDRVLEYIKRMNRPYGAVDVSSNLKGAVPKTATQKILAALAEKGELTQKTYGKTTFFAPNQDKIEAVSPEMLAELETRCKTAEEEAKALAAELKAASAELAKLRSTPTDAELSTRLEEARHTKAALEARLTPLRSDAPIVSAADMKELDAEWTKWRTEWVKRRKIFHSLWALITDSLPPQDAVALAEDLGIELDTEEHFAVERSELCAPLGAKGKGRR